MVFYVQGVGRRTALLSDGWIDRLVPVAVGEEPGHTGLCLEVHDLCAAKLLANRSKDHVYVGAMIQESFADPNVIWERVVTTKTDPERINAATAWLLDHCRVWTATGRTARAASYQRGS